MVRMSKKGQRRHVSPRRPTLPSAKTGPKKDDLPIGYKAHANALEGDLAKTAFIPKIS